VENSSDHALRRHPFEKLQISSRYLDIITVMPASALRYTLLHVEM
jgi:hypothetical protein